MVQWDQIGSPLLSMEWVALNMVQWDQIGSPLLSMEWVALNRGSLVVRTDSVAALSRHIII